MMCHKCCFVSFLASIKDLLYRQDCKILKAVTSVDNHPLASILPPKKENKYNLRKEQRALPKVNTERFMTSYVNRLIFKHKMMQFQRSFIIYLQFNQCYCFRVLVIECNVTRDMYFYLLAIKTYYYYYLLLLLLRYTR